MGRAIDYIYVYIYEYIFGLGPSEGVNPEVFFLLTTSGAKSALSEDSPVVDFSAFAARKITSSQT